MYVDFPKRRILSHWNFVQKVAPRPTPNSPSCLLSRGTSKIVVIDYSLLTITESSPLSRFLRSTWVILTVLNSHPLHDYIHCTEESWAQSFFASLASFSYTLHSLGSLIISTCQDALQRWWAVSLMYLCAPTFDTCQGFWIIYTYLVCQGFFFSNGAAVWPVQGFSVTLIMSFFLVVRLSCS